MMGNAQEHTRKNTGQRKEKVKKCTQRQRKRKDSVNLYRETKPLPSSSESSRFACLRSVAHLETFHLFLFRCYGKALPRPSG